MQSRDLHRRVPSRTTQAFAADAAVVPQRGQRARLHGPQDRRRPDPRRLDPRDPELRDGGMSTARHLLVPAVAAPGAGQPDPDRRLRRQGQGARRGRRAARADAATSSAAARRPRTVEPSGRAVRSRRHRRHRPARHRPRRAARLDHQLRAELSRAHRVLRRGFSLALHARRAGSRQGAACGRGSRLSCSKKASSPTARTSRTSRCPTSTSRP